MGMLSMFAIDLKEMTNNNPSLLSIVVPSYKAKDLNSIQQRVDGKVSQFLWSVVEKISERNVWVKKTLEEISYYCYMASNQLDIDEVNESEFQTTWIGSENILYLYRKKLYYNFPKIHRKLMSYITTESIKEQSILEENPTIKGYLFEQRIIHKISSEDRYYFTTQQNDAIAHISINVMMCIQKDVGEPVKDMQFNTLYRLRPYHPGFDAVGIFGFDNQNVLLYMQFSVLRYSDHRSKLDQIFAKAKAPECKNALSPYRYYVNLTRSLKPDKIVYIYMYRHNIYIADQRIRNPCM